HVGEVHAIAHQDAGLDPFSAVIDRRQPSASRELHDARSLRIHLGGTGHEERVGPFPGCRLERDLEVVRAPHAYRLQLQAETWGNVLNLPQLDGGARIRAVPEGDDPAGPG